MANNKKKKNKQKNRAPRQTSAQRVNRKPNASSAIMRGLSGVANAFIPGSGAIVSGVGKLLGFGAYTREQAQTLLASKVPSMHSTLDRGIRVSHHEYLGEISSSTAYAVSSYPINPGVALTFPWLSTLAGSFQKWEDNGVVFYFKSTSASALNSTNTALGTVVGAVTYNPYQTTPADKITMLGLAGAAAGKPAEDNLFPVECKLQQNLFGNKLVRSGNVSDDLAKYDSGNFHLARVGSQAAAVVGELHVVYDITLKEPKLAPNGWTSQHVLTGTVASATPLGTSAPTVVRDAFGLTFDVTNQTITFPKTVMSPTSVYLIQLIYVFTSAAWTGPAITSSSNATLVNYFTNKQNPGFFSPANGETCTIATVYKCVRPTVLGTEMVLSVSDGTLGVGAAGTLYVEEIDGTGL